MSKFKVGDHIAVYTPHRHTGTVSNVYLDGTLMVDAGTGRLYCHENQCRKLAPKKKPKLMKPGHILADGFIYIGDLIDPDTQERYGLRVQPENG